MRRLLVLIACSSAAVAATLAPASASTAPRPMIGGSYAERAPIDQPGGISAAFAWCAGSSAEPWVRTRIEGIDNDFFSSDRYQGTFPNYVFPRVEVGSYRITTVARCGDRTTQKIEELRVRQKSTATTMSREEFRRIKRGMTRAQVRSIIGYDGRFGGAYNGNRSRTYENMPFWARSSVDFRNGRVVGKSYNYGHD